MQPALITYPLTFHIYSTPLRFCEALIVARDEQCAAHEQCVAQEGNWDRFITHVLYFGELLASEVGFAIITVIALIDAVGRAIISTGFYLYDFLTSSDMTLADRFMIDAGYAFTVPLISLFSMYANVRYETRISDQIHSRGDVLLQNIPERPSHRFGYPGF